MLRRIGTAYSAKYYLIKNYNLEGLAYSNLIALTLYNSIRFLFLYKKFKLQPYTYKHGLFLLLSIGLILLVHQIPTANNILANILLQSTVFGFSFYLLVSWINPAPEALEIVNNFFKVKLPAIFSKK